MAAWAANANLGGLSADELAPVPLVGLTTRSAEVAHREAPAEGVVVVAAVLAAIGAVAAAAVAALAENVVDICLWG